MTLARRLAARGHEVIIANSRRSETLCEFAAETGARAVTAVEDGQAESAWVAGHVGRAVVKAFNNIVSRSLLENGLPEGATGRIALPVAGDPPGARRKVMRLVDELGFDPVDAGGLEESWRQQPCTSCYGADLDAPGLKEALAAAERGCLAEYRRKADNAARAFFASQPQ